RQRFIVAANKNRLAQSAPSFPSWNARARLLQHGKSNIQRNQCRSGVALVQGRQSEASTTTGIHDNGRIDSDQFQPLQRTRRDLALQDRSVVVSRCCVFERSAYLAFVEHAPINHKMAARRLHSLGYVTHLAESLCAADRHPRIASEPT